MSTSDTKVNDLCDDLEGCKLVSDEDLFKQPPPNDDCPICFQRLPSLSSTGSKYKACCGKVICSGCIHAPVYDDQGNIVAEKKCPFCRTPHPTSEKEADTREKKRMELDDPIAICNIGHNYYSGIYGFPQDYTKALEHWHRSAELGYTKVYGSIGMAYDHGRGVEVNKEKATHYFELAAMGGNVPARYNIGDMEMRAGNMDRALKHYMIAARDGYSNSLNIIKEMYLYGDATKDEYMKALRLYQEYLGEIKSVQRDKAAAFDERYRYY